MRKLFKPRKNKQISETQEILSPIKDYIFSLVFGDQRHIDILTAFLKTILDLPEEEYGSLVIVNPFLKRLFKTDKAGIVDVRLTTKSGRVIHVELQVKKAFNMPKRLVYYASKLLMEQIKTGQSWEKLHQVISIVICNHKLLPEEASYINAYEFRNDKTGGSFTDLIKFVILELPKLPHKEDSEVWPWLKLFTCKELNQYEELAKQHPEVGMAVQVLKRLSLIGRIRMMVDDLEIQRRDNEAAKEYELYEREQAREAHEQALQQAHEQALQQAHEQALQQGLHQGREEGRQAQLNIARKMRARNVAPEQIAEDTGLSLEEIATL
jgi:predicted transposase/invertase (TIGR01784 family)